MIPGIATWMQGEREGNSDIHTQPCTNNISLLSSNTTHHHHTYIYMCFLATTILHYSYVLLLELELQLELQLETGGLMCYVAP